MLHWKHMERAWTGYSKSLNRNCFTDFFSLFYCKFYFSYLFCLHCALCQSQRYGSGFIRDLFVHKLSILYILLFFFFSIRLLPFDLVSSWICVFGCKYVKRTQIAYNTNEHRSRFICYFAFKLLSFFLGKLGGEQKRI